LIHAGKGIDCRGKSPNLWLRIVVVPELELFVVCVLVFYIEWMGLAFEGLEAG